MPSVLTIVRSLIKDPLSYCAQASGITLRRYQQDVITAVLDSVFYKRGLSFVVVFPRQSGKNELQAQIECYLLARYSEMDAEIVKVSPTWKPQSINAMRRLERVLSRNLITRSFWKKESGYVFRFNRARVTFLSGDPSSNVVGATSNLLLEVDEAQDVQIAKFDKDIAPMAASTNATRIFWGTAWTSQTLLARELRAARAAQQRDGFRRVFHLTADDVAAEVPPYGKFVAEQVAKLGRHNPMVRTQFYSEEIDSEGGLFPPARLALMAGTHPEQFSPSPSSIYAFLLDIAGADEETMSVDDIGSGKGAGLEGKRDSTALTIIQVHLGNALPAYQVVARRVWTNVPHARLLPEIKALADLWIPRFIVVDATGVGAGLSSFLVGLYSDRVIPFVFTQASKSKLGWDFVSICDTGRFKDYAPPDPLFRQQLEFCQYEVLEGPARTIRWSVPDGSRDPATGDYLHDDLLVSAALSAVLDTQEWVVTSPHLVVKAKDPLKELSHGF